MRHEITFPIKYEISYVIGLRPTYITETKETLLIGYIKYMASHSFPLNIKQIHAFAWEIRLLARKEKILFYMN